MAVERLVARDTVGVVRELWFTSVTEALSAVDHGMELGFGVELKTFETPDLDDAGAFSTSMRVLLLEDSPEDPNE